MIVSLTVSFKMKFQTSFRLWLFSRDKQSYFGKDFLQNPGISVDVIIFVDAFFKDPKILNNVKLNVSWYYIMRTTLLWINHARFYGNRKTLVRIKFSHRIMCNFDIFYSVFSYLKNQSFEPNIV